MIRAITVITVLAAVLIGCGQKTESKEVLFVCTHGAARSPIAAAYFDRLAKEQGLNYHAVFRGTEPDAVLTKETITGLTKDGFDISDWKPEKVSISDIERADRIITFDCTLPMNNASPADEEQWNGTPSISKDYNKARNAIKDKTEQLIETLLKD